MTDTSHISVISCLFVNDFSYFVYELQPVVGSKCAHYSHRHPWKKKKKKKKKKTLNHTDTTWTLMRTKSGPEIHFDPPNAALELLLWAQCLCVCFISFPPQSCQSIPSETAGTPPLWTKTLPLWPSSQACPGDFLTASLYCGSRSMSDRNQISTLGPPVDNKSSSSVASDGYESIWVINNAKNK